MPRSQTRQLPSEQDSTGRTFGQAELRLLERVLASGTLNSTRGWAVKQLEDSFAALLDIPHALACASGTAAVHTAVAAFDPEPGDEFVTSPLTDFGGIAPILQQGAIPVFADVDPVTGAVTPETVEPLLSDRTRAVIVTHLYGLPADTVGIAALGPPIIEDCAQAPLARRPEGTSGTLGAVGCFSLQQTKHITTGEGGLLVTADEEIMTRMHAFVNKARCYTDPVPDHHFLAPNYRMTELAGAVAVAQLERLEGAVARRRELAARLTAAIGEIEGVSAVTGADARGGSFWKYTFQVRDGATRGGAAGLAERLAERGIPASSPTHVPAFEWTAIRERRTFGTSQWPFTLARPQALDHSPDRLLGVRDHLARTVAIAWNDRYSDRDVEAMATAIADGCSL